MSREPDVLIVTCEHGGHDVPPEHRSRFRGARDVLRSHRGHDAGALPVARRLAEALAAPLFASTTTRLLVDLNRSLDHPSLFSESMRDVDDAARRAILDRHYRPFRDGVRRTIGHGVDAGHRVVHLSVHSFVDVLEGRRRELDIGLLFDPARASEASLCEAWREALRSRHPDLRVAFNEPYLGVDDGHTTALRRLFPDRAYLGIEIELRQGIIGSARECRVIGDRLAETLRPLIIRAG